MAAPDVAWVVWETSYWEYVLFRCGRVFEWQCRVYRYGGEVYGLVPRPSVFMLIFMDFWDASTV